MPRQLHPVSQTIVGWLFLVAGILLLLGLALQAWVRYCQLRESGSLGPSGRQWSLGLAMLAAAIIMVRVGWRMRSGRG
jgi:hypothetical protein